MKRTKQLHVFRIYTTICTAITADRHNVTFKISLLFRKSSLDCDEKRQEKKTEVVQLRFNRPLLGVNSRNRMTKGKKIKHKLYCKLRIWQKLNRC